MKFIEFLSSCEDCDIEVFADNLEESRHSFSWGEECKITKDGQEKFRKILDSSISIVNGNVKLLDNTITQEEYDLWMEAVAGYVPVNVWDGWFEREAKQ